MDWNARLLSAYLRGPLELPAWLQRGLIHAYLAAYHGWGIWRGGGEPTVEPSTVVAERTSELMAAHYNLPLALFASMLGRTMKYSMALWETGATDLDSAQTAMLDDVCDKAGIQDGQSILDIGCGFGSFAAHALRRYPRCTVVGLTPSRTQADYLRRCQAQAGHALQGQRFQLVEADLDHASLRQRFDRVVSLGVFEHVSNLSLALEQIHGLLHPAGSCFLHYIVFRRPLHRMRSRPSQDTLIARHIFPGGRVWFDEELQNHQERLRIARHWFLNGQNYRRTLEEWLRRFQASRSLLAGQSGLDTARLRLWELYLRTCIGVFALHGGDYYGNAQYLLVPR